MKTLIHSLKPGRPGNAYHQASLLLMQDRLQVATEVRQARRDELVSLQQDIGQEFAISLIGREVR